MIEAQFGDDLQLSNLFCNNNNAAKLLCCGQSCLNCALTCLVQSCQCNSKDNPHPNCQFINTESIIKKVLKKKRILTKEVEQGFQAVLKAYQSIIDQLSFDKHKLTVWKESYGLSYQEATLINSVRDNNRTELIGDLVFKVKTGLKQNNKETNQIKEWFNKAEFEQFWNFELKGFNKLRKQLSEFYQSALNQYQSISVKMDLNSSFAYKIDEQTNAIQKINQDNDWQTIAGMSPLPKRNKISF